MVPAPPSPASSPLLCLGDLSIAYPHSRGTSPQENSSPWAVRGVSLEVYPGECLGLVGESGCGKSTLGRAMLRLLPPGSQVQGRLDFDQTPVLSLEREALRRFRGEAVGLVFQDPMTRLDPLMTIGEHCATTLKAHRPQLGKQAVRDRVGEVLDVVKIPRNRWQQYPHEFSGGMRQRVAIALTLLLNPRLIVADEPTTSLDVTVSAQILDELTGLCRDRQMGLILISHDLALVGQYCDRIAVIFQGEKVEDGPTQQVLYEPQHPYTQKLLHTARQLHGDATPPAQVSDKPPATPAPAPLLQVRDLQYHYSLETNPLARWLGGSGSAIKAVDGVSFDLEAGETLGLVGESGCGKSTLCRTILRLRQPTQGSIRFEGQDLIPLPVPALRQLRRQMQMIFQDPRACLNPLMTVGQNITDPLHIHGLVSSSAAAQAEGLALLERVGLNPGDSFYHRYPHELSGGQQQRVAIARALITRPKLILCDEPVSMLDATVQAQVLDLMGELKREFNLTYLFVTHDLWVARSFCDRIAVMNGGKIVEIAPSDRLFRQPQHPYTQSLLRAAPVLRAA